MCDKCVRAATRSAWIHAACGCCGADESALNYLAQHLLPSLPLPCLRRGARLTRHRWTSLDLLKPRRLRSGACRFRAWWRQARVLRTRLTHAPHAPAAARTRHALLPVTRCYAPRAATRHPLLPANHRNLVPWGDPAWYRAYNSPYITPSQCATPRTPAHACARPSLSPPPFAHGSLAWRKKMRAFTEKEVMPFVHAWCAAALFVRFSPQRLCGSVALAQTKAWITTNSEVGLGLRRRRARRRWRCSALTLTALVLTSTARCRAGTRPRASRVNFTKKPPLSGCLLPPWCVFVASLRRAAAGATYSDGTNLHRASGRPSLRRATRPKDSTRFTAPSPSTSCAAAPAAAWCGRCAADWG